MKGASNVKLTLQENKITANLNPDQLDQGYRADNTKISSCGVSLAPFATLSTACHRDLFCLFSKQT